MRRIKVDKEELESMLLLGVSRPELAKHFKCSIRTIANRVKEYGFINLTPNNKPTPIVKGRKKCRSCNISKYLEHFNKHSKKTDGLRSYCRECEQEYYEKNKEEIRLRHKKHYNNNKEYYNAKSSTRRAAKIKATPPWYTELDQFILEEMNSINSIRKDLFGVQFHIDHIIPLKGNNVCGLHYHKNWQILTAKENFRKSNKYE